MADRMSKAQVRHHIFHRRSKTAGMLISASARLSEAIRALRPGESATVNFDVMNDKTVWVGKGVDGMVTVRGNIFDFVLPIEEEKHTVDWWSVQSCVSILASVGSETF